jgi:undecaprenyl-diphosphatase
VSRSGITITAGRFLGLNRDAAARVSFLLLVPATAAAAVVKGADAISTGLPPGVGAPIVVGIISSAVTGYLAIAGLLALVRRHSYTPFVIYRLIAGVLILAMIATGVRDATL